MKTMKKISLAVAMILCSLSAWGANITMPKGVYYFDFSGFSDNDNIFEVQVFNNINSVEYITFSNVLACNSGVTPDASDKHLYRNLTTGFSNLAIEITTAYSAGDGDGFIQVRHGANNSNTSWAGWFDYTAPTEIGAGTYVCKVTPSGYTWGTSGADYPACVSGLVTPTLTFSANANGSIITHTAGGSVVNSGVEVDSGTAVVLTAQADKGYEFAYWTNNGEIYSRNANLSFSMPSTSMTLVANFTAAGTDPSISGCADCFLVAP